MGFERDGERFEDIGEDKDRMKYFLFLKEKVL